ncbi:hypothetical protein B0H17DRAFT_1133887 [Mycena rosella]|uniref:Uncharacterized protein n=1 Tax=Mycena rosella TaxID=1033263 RepID=A0AAD7DH27_MYCRO|nr:hypothetical protein B0H17DRAFT_1133887 [Mycena rosella]
MPPLRDAEEDDLEDESDPTGIPSWFEDQYLMRQKACLKIVNDNGTQYKGYNPEGRCIGDTLGMAVARLLDFSQPYPGDERLCLTTESYIVRDGYFGEDVVLPTEYLCAPQFALADVISEELAEFKDTSVSRLTREGDESDRSITYLIIVPDVYLGVISGKDLMNPKLDLVNWV